MIRRLTGSQPWQRCSFGVPGVTAQRNRLSSNGFKAQMPPGIRTIGLSRCVSHTANDTLRMDYGLSARLGDGLKHLPRDPEALKLHVGCIGAMTVSEVIQLTEMLHTIGAAVLTPEREDDELETYTTLNRLFGEHVWHDSENEHGVVKLDPLAPTSINVADTEHCHQPHTDDAYTEKPATFMTLNCRVAAKSGGESVLVSGADFWGHLSLGELNILMQPGMVTMGRRPANADPDAPWKFTSSIPMFWVGKESQRLNMRWRCKDRCVKEVAPEALDAYERLNQVALDDSKRLIVPLQPTQVLVVDNFAHAHGRTPYAKGEARVLWRKNYFGNGELETSITTGVSDYGVALDSLSAARGMFD